MADRYFVGDTDNTWNDANNWSLTSGGAGGAGVPTSSDNVYFDANSPDCTVDIDAECLNLDTTGYTNTLSFGSYGLTAATGGAVTLASGTVNLGSGTHTFYGDFTYSGGTLNYQTSTVQFYALDDGSTQNISGTFSLYNLSFIHSGFTVSATRTHNLNAGTITVHGDLYMQGNRNGTTTWDQYINNGTIIKTGSGKIYCATGRYIQGNSTLRIQGTGVVTLEDFNFCLANLYFEQSAGGICTATSFNIGYAYLANSINLYFNSDVDFSGVDTVNFHTYGYKDVLINATIDIPEINNLNITLGGSTGKDDFMTPSNRPVIVLGDLTISVAQSTWQSRINNGKGIEVYGDVSYTCTVGGTFAGSTPIKMVGGSDATLSINTTKDWNPVEIAKDSTAVVTCTGPYVYIGAAKNLTVTSGVLKAEGYDITCDTLYVAPSSMFYLYGDQTITTNSVLASGTVVFCGGVPSYISRLTNDYYGLTLCDGNSCVFEASGVYNVTGNFCANNATLRSSVDGTEWFLNVTGDQNVMLVDVKDSNASGGDTIINKGGTDSGNNTNWEFCNCPALYSGNLMMMRIS